MAEAARLAPDLAGPEWILALEQTAGRGRRGRAWQMPPGNFAASLVMRPAGGPEQAALRSFVAALSLRDALLGATGRASALSLKWPNDVLLNGGKVAGILLESAGRGAELSHLVVGIGVNLVAAPPPETLEPGATAAVSVRGETGITVAPAEFLDLLAPAFARWEGQFATFGFAPIRAAWLAQAARLGETISARIGTETAEGRFETVDETGNLVLQTARGRRIIPAADIHF